MGGGEYEQTINWRRNLNVQEEHENQYFTSLYNERIEN